MPSKSVSSGRMRAVVVDHAVPEKLAIREVSAPEPNPAQALIRVAAVSLNRGEVRNAIDEDRDGARIGWDLAGVVERAAAGGSGCKAGTRVVGLDPSGG